MIEILSMSCPPRRFSSAASAPGWPPTLPEALRICEEVQHMIDINADHLERLRNSVGEKTTSGKDKH